MKTIYELKVTLEGRMTGAVLENPDLANEFGITKRRMICFLCSS